MDNITNNKSMFGSPQVLDALVAYQSGAVVSREILNRSAGTVTLFSFDTGQGLSEHTSPFDALVVVISGEADMHISGRATTVREGEVIILPANEPHAVSAVNRFKMMLVMIRS